MVKFCPTCGKQLEFENAEICPSCGVRIQPTSSNSIKPENTTDKVKSAGKWIAICCGGIILLVIISSVFSYIVLGPEYFKSESVTGRQPSVPLTPTIDPIIQIKSNAQIIPYDDLFRYNEKYIGDTVYYRGEILQISPIYGDNYVLRVATKQGQYVGYIEDVLYVNYKGSRYLEGDTIDLWGKVDGLESYSAVLGNTITIPKVTALHTELVSKAS